MQRELMDILSSRARKLTLVRAVESGAVVAAGLAPACAMLQVASAMVDPWPIAATLVALCPLVPAVVFTRQWVSNRLGLSQTQALTLAALSLLCAWGGVYVLFSPVAHPAVIPLVLLPAGFAAGVLTVLLRRMSLHGTAVYLDLAGGLCERVSTACELAGRNDVSPEAQVVCAQALASLKSSDVRKAPMWRRGRATAGVLLLAGAFCAALAMLPKLTSGGWRVTPETVASALGELSPDAARQLQRALRRGAMLASGDPALARRFFQAARAVEIRDDSRLAELLRQLQERGVDLATLIPQDVQRAMGLGEDDPIAMPAERTGRVGEPAGSVGAGPLPAGGTVRVYAPVAATAKGAAPAGGNDTGQFVPFEDAWSRTRARVADALTRGSVPPEYRRLVRDFFLAD